ncbi:hypothetical protein DW1_0665 [Proteiniborus sp. DW1]|uniref:hypothetical protein n=1 Tax=Proteiniborus sp. DW1 TaxID=1889883 RepID=UPI00092E088F|nr:hypothetical protein [Proteiniborus sp. DW1]SCG82274.1 hypothetical protein DW1_0665 [Proteiniborus sp. DW1]
MFNFKKNIALRLLFILVLAVVIFIPSSCTKKQEKPKLQTEEEKIPEKLKNMQEKNEDIIEQIEKILEEMKKPEEPKKLEQKEQQQQGQSSQQGSEDGGNKKGGSEGGSQPKTSEKSDEQEKQKTKEQKIEEMWTKVKKTSEEIHNSWGDYEILAIENGIKKQELTKFEETINKLTISIDKKKIEESLVYSNDITYDMAPFFDLYKGNHEGELMRLRYFIRQVLLYGMQGEWDKSEETITQAEESMNTARAKIKLEKEDQKLMEKLGLSIANMKTSIPMKNVELLKIKRDIVLKNVDEIKDKL